MTGKDMLKGIRNLDEIIEVSDGIIAPGYTDDHQEVGMRVACRNGLK